jgi:hypothetical protein
VNAVTIQDNGCSQHPDHSLSRGFFTSALAVFNGKLVLPKAVPAQEGSDGYANARKNWDKAPCDEGHFEVDANASSALVNLPLIVFISKTSNSMQSTNFLVSSLACHIYLCDTRIVPHSKIEVSA